MLSKSPKCYQSPSYTKYMEPVARDICIVHGTMKATEQLVNISSNSSIQSWKKQQTYP